MNASEQAQSYKLTAASSSRLSHLSAPSSGSKAAMTQTWPHLTERSKEDTGVSLYGYVISAFRAVALSDTEQCPVAVLHWLNAYTSEAMRLPDRKHHL